MDQVLKVKSAADVVRAKFNLKSPIKSAVVLGSGLGDFGSQQEVSTLSYDDIPGFPHSTVLGHAGELALVEDEGGQSLVFRGRVHLYEGYEPGEVCFGIRMLKFLQVESVVLTNAAGALNPLFDVGGLMVIEDHINLTGRHVLAGKHDPRWGERFPDMSAVYDQGLIRLAHACALESGMKLEKGVYAAVHGPELETPAETRFYRQVGADAIGMSTVLESTVAHQMGIKVLGISCLTNKNLPDCMAETSHLEILEQAEKSGRFLELILKGILKKISALSDFC